jgi:hypothetical protein
MDASISYDGRIKSTAAPVADTQTAPKITREMDEKIQQFVQSQSETIANGALSESEVSEMHNHLQAAVAHLKGRISKEHLPEDKIERKLAKIESRIKAYIQVKQHVESRIREVARLELPQEQKEALGENVRGLGIWLLEHIVDGKIKTEETVHQFLAKIDSVVSTRISAAPQRPHVMSQSVPTVDQQIMEARKQEFTAMDPETERITAEHVNPLLAKINKGDLDLIAEVWIEANNIKDAKLSQESKLVLSQLVRDHTAVIRSNIRSGLIKTQDFPFYFDSAKTLVTEGMQGYAYIDHRKQLLIEKLRSSLSETAFNYMMGQLGMELSKLNEEFTTVILDGNTFSSPVSNHIDLKKRWDKLEEIFTQLAPRFVPQRFEPFYHLLSEAVTRQEHQLAKGQFSPSGQYLMNQTFDQLVGDAFAKFARGNEETKAIIEKLEKNYQRPFAVAANIEKVRQEILKQISTSGGKVEQQTEKLEGEILKLYQDWSDSKISSPTEFEKRLTEIKAAFSPASKPVDAAAVQQQVKAQAKTLVDFIRQLYTEIDKQTEDVKIQEDLKAFLRGQLKEAGLTTKELTSNPKSVAQIRHALSEIDLALQVRMVEVIPRKK